MGAMISKESFVVSSLLPIRVCVSDMEILEMLGVRKSYIETPKIV